jgi:hypothetical protein
MTVLSCPVLAVLMLAKVSRNVQQCEKTAENFLTSAVIFLPDPKLLPKPDPDPKNNFGSTTLDILHFMYEDRD